MGTGRAIRTDTRSRMGEWALRVLTVLALLAAAWIHLELWRTGYRDIDTIGTLFLVNVVAGGVLAVAVLVWRHWLPAVGAVGFGLATLGAYLLSRTVGLFGMTASFGSFHFVLGIGAQLFAAIAEAVCVLGGAALVPLRWRSRAG